MRRPPTDTDDAAAVAAVATPADGMASARRAVPVVARGESAALGAGPLPDVSVVVATHDRAAMVGELLAALEEQTVGVARFEVVVVDDCSGDATWQVLGDMAAQTSLRLVALRLGSNHGAGTARTVGAEHARAPVVAFTDDDCLPAPDWLERLVAPLRTADGPPPSLVVQGRTVPSDRDAEAAGPWARTVWVLRPTWLFETCNIAYRRSDLLGAGGFVGWEDAPRSATGRPTGEDALLGWAVVAGGARLVFEPAALVHHRNFPATYGAWLAEQRGRSVFPALASRSPYARRAFWGRWFLSQRSAATVLAVAAGTAWVARRRSLFLLGVVPWVVLAMPEAQARHGRHPALRLGQIAVADLAGLAATAAASARHRTLVL